ncbi:multidrug effflux MFS transporter [Tepidimonas taiwanensis]|uniref:Bcr/CflA family efflux transporter n=1 Tax=Tepidimonas taiwanensis TaxID=307486 RepID=A0A554X6S7_9BURK|nr:multidrug effflux MFS transporter [Tepidimonas taiwanensis]MCX7692355.1 multidrug effflux MFS transporter [Tepidimonas taiwanensis]MDM7462922.1 multidrug effflux MFS transporter [Tepidimonas taiwanensis]TSE31533.1 Bicyclomycin resistance protein [Tepidimonas taiwanensis]UBQ06225.1 multidrug effflux MFS transporter [Tepidimonas taiwanensis]
MQAASPAPAAPMPPGWVVVFLSLLLGVQPLATDLYLPALPAITAAFDAPMAKVQATLTALLLSFGAAQLVWGPVSDRYGRRPVLLAGLAAYTLASIGNALAASIEQLILWRIVQGAAMGAAVMGARAIVRDLYQPVEGARMMSKGLSGLGIFACISGPLGGWLTEHFGWRVTLAALAVFSAVALALVALRFRETLPARNPRALQPREMLTIWSRIARHPTFWAWALLAATSYGGLFTFLATSSFVFITVLGLTKTQYGLLMLSMSLVYIAGTILCRRLIPRVGVRRTVAIAAGFTLAGGTLCGLLAHLGWHGTWTIMGPYYLFILAHGVHQPCGQSGAVSPFPQAAGAASALAGFIMMLTAFGMGTWLGLTMSTGPDAGVYPLTNGLWFWAVAIAAVAWILVQRHGEVRTQPQPAATR